MPFEHHEERNYALEGQAVYQAALKANEKLQGQVFSSKPENLRFETRFPKTILGKVLGDRTYLACEVRPTGEGSLVVVDAYPLDAVERKLMFGARKGVVQTVVSWFFAHLENNLGLTGK